MKFTLHIGDSRQRIRTNSNKKNWVAGVAFCLATAAFATTPPNAVLVPLRLAATVSDNQLDLLWPVRENYRYTVLETGSLMHPDWREVAMETAAADGHGHFDLLIGTAFKGFYSVRESVETTPRIRVRPGTNTGEFYYTKDNSSQLFEPCGSSWVILHEEADGDKKHANFSPEIYSSISAERALIKMEQSGYNVVRTFIFKGHFRCTELTTVGGSTRDTTGELNEAYMTNFLDFLERARNHNLHVQVVLDGWPWTTYYRDIALTDLPDIEGNNRENMTPGSIAAKVNYLERVVLAVKDAGLGTTVFSYEISNEPCSWTDAKPFSVTNGIFETAAGTYDMSSAASRQACADDNLTLALSTWRDAVKGIDPDALVNVGIFSYAAVGKAGMATNGLLPLGTSDVRWPGRMKDVVSVTDFGDLHMYIQSTGTTVAQHMESQEWSLIPNKNTKPFISGEFGAHRTAYPDDTAAAAALFDWRQDMLDAGFSGAELFTWDTLNHTRWTAIEGSEAVNDALKPGDVSINEIYLPQTNTASTIALWHMDATNSTYNRIDDASGHGKHLWLAGDSTITSGHIGNSLALDGDGDHGAKSDFWQAYDQVQIDLWINSSATISECYLVDIPDVLRLRLKDDSIWFDVQQDNGTWVSRNLPSRLIENGQLEHIRAICDGGAIRLIRADGTQASAPFSGVPMQVVQQIDVGRSANGDKYFSGTLDEIRIQAK